MVAPVEFQSYLESLLENSPQEKSSRENYVPSWTNLPLQVQTHNSSSSNQELKQTKEEKYLVLEGLRKYALEQVLLVGKPGSGKSTALLQLQKEEARRRLEAIEQDEDEIPQIPVLVELRNLKDLILKTIKDKLDWWIDLDDQAFKKLFRDRKILILLD